MQQYKCIADLGEGIHGLVSKVEKDGAYYAAKRFDECNPCSLREISIANMVSHPNVVCAKDTFKDDSWLYDYMDTDLWYASREMQLSSHQKRIIAHDIVAGMAYLHNMHRDLASRNILLNTGDKMRAAIADFGLSKMGGSIGNHTPGLITLWYRPLELMIGCKEYGYAVDMWSVGCILYELYTGQTLFPGDSEVDQMMKIFQVLGTPTDASWEGVTKMPHYKALYPQCSGNAQIESTIKDPILVDLIYKCLTYNPKNRITASLLLRYG